MNFDDLSGFDKYEIVGIYEWIWNLRFCDRNSCYKYCMVYGCKWYDGLMIDIFVLSDVDCLIYFLKRMNFEGFLFLV